MKVLLLNQCFWPDVVATAQQLTDLAVELAERGHEVTVVCSNRGYDDQELRFPGHEQWNNITIIRVPSTRAHKDSRWRRALNCASFLIACAFRLAVLPRQHVVVALTSPPLISWLASRFTRFKGGRLITWIMDLNPDEAIAAGWLKSDSITARLLEALSKSSLLHAEKIIVLDRFMKARMAVKGIPEELMRIVPPWSHDNSVRYDQQGGEAFRRAQTLSEKFVVMYAGNHSPCHPLDTLLQAASRLKELDDVVFCFVGGGSEQNKVREFARANHLNNILVLPYQTRENLSACLSAADFHVVVMGEVFAGIIHPSKIYNILAIGAPFLYIGPTDSHIADIIAKIPDCNMASHAMHGQAPVVAEFITERANHHEVSTRREPPALARDFSQRVLLSQLIAEIESAGVELAAPATQSAETKLQSA